MFTCAAVVIHTVRQSVHDVLQSLIQDMVRQRFAQGKVKHFQVGCERVLVHAVHQSHLCQHEEQDSTALGSRPVAVSQFINVQRRLLSQL